jgi:hypothetical protein
VNLRGILDFLECIARDARLREDFEARAGIAKGPRRKFNFLLF